MNELLSKQTKLIITPGLECGLTCPHCLEGRRGSKDGEISRLLAEHIPRVQQELISAGVTNVEIVKVAGLRGDCFLTHKEAELLALVDAVIEQILVDSKRHFDLNGYPRVHLITNGLFITDLALKALRPRINYIGITLSIDSFHHKGSARLHFCRKDAPAHFWADKHLSACPYIQMLVAKTKLITRHIKPEHIFVNVTENEPTRVNKHALAALLALPASNIFANTPIFPTAEENTAPRVVAGYNASTIFMASRYDTIALYPNYSAMLANRPQR